MKHFRHLFLVALALSLCLPGRADSFFVDNVVYRVLTSSTVSIERHISSKYSGNFVIPETVTLLVPSGSESAYETAPAWSEFKNIFACDFIGTTQEGAQLAISIINEDEKTAMVTGALDKSITGDLTIPAEINGYHIIAIGDNAFQSLKISSIIISEGVAAIGKSALYRSSIESAKLPHSLITIDENAFQDCNSLKSIVIPDNVTYIGNEAFYGCDSLLSILLPKSLIEIPESLLAGCGQLRSLNIPQSVERMDKSAFDNCDSISSIVVDVNNKIFDSRNNCNAIVETATNTLIRGCGNSKIDNTITKIGDEAFYDVSGLTSIDIPSSVTSIGSSAFSYSDITEIIIPSSVKTIEDYAFYSCKNLSTVILSDGLTTLGASVFDSCISLHEISIPGTLETIGGEGGDGMFFNSGLNSVTIRKGVKHIGKYAFCQSPITDIELPEGITTIGYGAFMNCSNLRNVKLPESLTTIEDFAFTGSSGIEIITIPKNVTSIGEYNQEIKGETNVEIIPVIA